VARFLQATALDGYKVRSVAELTLTFENPDYAAAQGEISRFWHEVRARFPRARYFCWLELHRDGRLHYHALWLNPPPRHQFDLHQDVARIWRNGRTRGRRKWPKDWSQHSLDYVLAYAKKIGKKAYQQDYDQLPTALRTFMSQRLGYDLALLDRHRDSIIARYVPEVSDLHRYVPAQLELVGEWLHGPGRWCDVRRGGTLDRSPPLLRQAHTGLPGRAWREQRSFIVQGWLPT
jgi:hypothetical protein